MADELSIPAQHQFAFPADWEWCDARVTYKPRWKPLGSTPQTLKFRPGRAHRVSVRPLATPADLADILRAAARFRIRIVRVPHGGPIPAPGLGDVLAELTGVETVGLTCPRDSTGWLVSLGRVGGHVVQVDLDGWPVDEVTAAVGRVRRAAGLTVRMDGYGTGFRLGPLFGIRGLKRVHVEHCSHCQQELDWTGLAAQGGLTDLEVRAGMLAEGFWSQVGQLPRLRALQLWWPEAARAAPNSLARLASLRALEVVCLFDPVPAAFRALGRAPAIERVKLDQCDDLDDPSAAGVGSMARARDVHIWNAKLSDTRMRALCRWPRVKSLVLAEDSGSPTPVTERGFRALGDLRTLESLHLQGFEHVGRSGWAALRRLPRLKRLQLTSNPPFDVLGAIGPVPSVNALSLWYCNVVGSAGLRQLHAMPRLTTLGIHVNNYHPYLLDVGDVSEVRTLTALALGNLDKMTDEQVGSLARLGRLERLFLQEAARVTDRGVAALARLPSLRALWLDKMPRLTDEAAAALARFPRLESLHLRCNSRITDKGLSALAAARRLTTLHLEFARNLTGEGLLRLVRKLPLEELVVASSPHLTDEHLAGLVRHPTLRRVAVRECKNVTAEGWRALAAARPDWGRPSFQYWEAM